MIAYLHGTLATKDSTFATIECGGVGYEVQIPLSTYNRLPEINNNVKLLIHYAFNESDGVRLFGFSSPIEKDLFRRLISISKIGPKIALSVLSTLPAEDLIQAVQFGNVGLLATVPGIGKKSAERLIIELKDKVGSILAENLIDLSEHPHTNITQEAEDALIALGYKQFEVRKVIRQLAKEHDFKSSEEVVKTVIKSLYRNRNI